jgi:hypothetical protein
MKLRSIGTGLFLVSVVFVISCRTEKSADSEPHDQVRSAVSRIPGWVEQKDKYCSFKPDELYGIIDGGATEYIEQGLKSGIGIACTSGTKTLGMYFEDFGTELKAQGMVEAKKASLSEPQAIPNVTLSPALYGEVIGGCIACWAKDRYYVEMTLTGYDSVGIALKDAGIFIDSISRVIGK